MKKAAALICSIVLLACPGTSGTGSNDAGNGDAGVQSQRIEVASDVTRDTTWSKNNTYILKTLVYVNGATLTIEAGTTILGDSGSALITTKTGKLAAVGTANAPIVFSSNYPAGMRGIGTNNWGGVMLNGKAAINVVGGDTNAEGVVDDLKNHYGGGSTPDGAFDCGTLKYVRIEFAGQPLSANNELNGLTLNACGSGTTIDFVQVHRGLDDGIELFGGSVDIKHAVISGSDDDGLDFDQGWTGRAQFVVIQQLPGRGNFGIEGDNNRSGQDLIPRSHPVMSNFTLIGRAPDTSNSGEGTSRGMTYRVGASGELHNSIVTNFTDWAMFVDGTSSSLQWANGGLVVKNTAFFRNGSDGFQNVRPPALSDGGVGLDLLDEGTALATNTLGNSSDVDPQLSAGVSASAPNFKAANASLAAGGSVPSGSFFEPAAFKGAIGTVDWTAGWTAYPEN